MPSELRKRPDCGVTGGPAPGLLRGEFVGCGQVGGEICVHMADRSGTVPTVRVTACFCVWRRMRGAGGCGEGVFDPLADGILVAVGAVQVDLVKDAGTGPGPGGDLGGLAGGVQPQGQGGVPQVVGAAGQWRGGQAGAEGG
jgi:hypothetical protein